ncbi:MAG: hypothetical protein KF819_22435 [Labilithrix sp.]|nr:hypothetical protein [Labilithrix sp.]
MRLRCVAAFVIAIGTIGCHRPKHYETNVEITRVTAARKDDKGKVLTIDLEYAFSECPGSQLEVLRGDAEFAACIGKHKVGDKVPVSIDHEWADDGHWQWVVRKVGDCRRVADPNDEASFAVVRECEDWNVNGNKVGFQCRYLPEKNLLEKCPWFKRN